MALPAAVRGIWRGVGVMGAKHSITIHGRFFETQQKAADFFGVHPGHISNAKAKGRLDLIGKGSEFNSRPCIIEGVEYSSRKHAGESLGVTPQSISHYLTVMDAIARAKGGA